MSNRHLHPLIHTAQYFPTNTAVVQGDTTLSYLQLYEGATQISQALSARGYGSGDIIVVHKLKPLEFIHFFWACSMLGLIILPLNDRFPRNALKSIIDSLNPVLVVSDESGEFESSSTYKSLTLLPGSSKEIRVASYNPELAVSLLMTSGSSGSTKLVQHCLSNHIASAVGSNQNIPFSVGDRWLMTLPLYHVGGLSLLFRSIISGATLVISESSNMLSQDISRNGITHISLVSTQLQRLLNDPETSTYLTKMKAILLGGSAFPQALIQDCLKHDLPIHLSYGSTEMASQITTTRAEERSQDLAHSGTLLADRDLIISHRGEILLRGATLAMGYRTGMHLSPLTDSEGWFHSGDVGYLSVGGKLTVTGRMDNQFISGGENIQPEHIERAMNKLPGISQTIVVPEIDLDFGYHPVAFIQTDDSEITLKTIWTSLKDTLPSYMLPKTCYLLPDEMILDQFKISRQELMKLLVEKNKHLHSLP